MSRIPVLFLLIVGVAQAVGQDPQLRLTVSPAKEPVPALKYPLLPAIRDQSAGNAALLYYRAFSPDWLTHRRPETAKVLDAWRNDTSKKPGEELRWVLTYKPLEEIDKAARRSYCEWEQHERLRKEGIYMLLPDVQSMREFANLLALRARFQLQAGEYDKAVHTFQTGFALSRHVAEGLTLIQALVGLAINNIMLAEVERWIEKPDAPNLYWSLTALPSPYIDLRRSLQGERFFMDSLFPNLREAMIEKKPELFGQDRMRVVVRDLQLAGVMNLEGDMPNLGGKLGLALYAAKVYPEAKKALVAEGWKAEVVEQMPVTVTALMYEVLNYERIYDDLIKWYGTPYAEAKKGMAKAMETITASPSGVPVGKMLARMLLPALDKVIMAGLRTDRKIAALRCVEAMRLFAAEKGRWPEKLAEMTEVPIPKDPLTGAAFEYRVEKDKATLTAPAPTGEKATRSNSIEYILTLRK